MGQVLVREFGLRTSVWDKLDSNKKIVKVLTIADILSIVLPVPLSICFVLFVLRVAPSFSTS